MQKLVSPPWYHHVQKRLIDKNRKIMGLTEKDTKQLRFLKIFRFFSFGCLFSTILGILIFTAVFAWFTKDLPQPGKVVRREGFSTQLLDREGRQLYDVYGDERREPVTFDHISQYMRQATVATEDKDFYVHGGFDPLTPIRIVYNYIFRRGRVVGGSTLTQQLVKNVLLTNDRSLIRKAKELILSMQIERQFTKDQILEMYLNEVPYGSNAAGVEAAAQLYFNKDASQLSLVESSILAGLPQRPSAYSPFSGKKTDDGVDLWKWRALGVLRRMKEDGYISEDLEKTADAELDAVVFQQQSTSIKAPHFVFYVKDQLEEMFGPQLVENGGLKVFTTLDLQMQNVSQDIVKEEIEKVESLNITNGSVIVLDPQTGEILTMIGSKDYFSTSIDGKFNVGVNGLRQPGSSIKPVTYLAALKKGYTPSTMLIDTQTVFQPNDQIKAYEPKNYDGKYHGPVPFRTALGSSLNVTAVKLLANVGVPNMLQLAYDMGFPTLEPTEQNLRNFGLAVTLGGGEVHLIDTVSAYSAFANGGTKVEPVSILKVEDHEGHVLYQYKPVAGKRVMEPGEAFLMDDILTDNNARLLAFGANSQLNTKKPIAVKTGTTNDQKDNWTIGWSKTTMVGVWVGNNNNTAMKKVASGITGASPIWLRVMNEAIAQGRETPAWEMPDDVEQVDVDQVSGYPAHDGYATKKEYILKGTLPQLPDPIHAKVKLCRGQNKLAPETRVAQGDYEEKEFIVLKENDPVSQDGKNRWQDAINAWITGQSDDKFKTPTEYCNDHDTGDQLFVKVNKPSDQTNYPEQAVDVEIDAVGVNGIAHVEIWVNGNKRETLTDRPYTTRLQLGNGRFEIYAKAKDNSGTEVESSHLHIGTGGANWQEPTPTPLPSSTPESTAAPTSTPIVPAVPL
ncbi:MAG: transglycosylase domain-containing protein [Patescibacteria group bacterium]